MRQVLRATALQDRPAAEVAQELGITEENVRQLKARGLRILSELVPERKD
jgi:DNA-directed RNA polymerase specialized sigma24 family protein